MQQQRQQSASVEPMPTTVDPSQVYDIRAEREKAARIEAERRRKVEAEQAARKAEEDARQAEEDARKAEEERIEAEARKAEEDARKAREAEAKKKATAERKKEARRKANEEKQSKTAATALQQMAAGSSGGGGGGSMESMAAMMGNMSGPPANDEEAEMRAMFKKMREFNQKNPAMLAKLWEEERKQHAAQAPPGTAPPAQPVQTGLRPSAPTLTKKQEKAAATAPTLASPTVPPPAQPTVPNSRPNIALPIKNAQAPLSTSSQGASSLWPPHKKGSLAEAAARWLTTLPENVDSGKTISSEEVVKILDTNPSYVQLCEVIEKKGIRFERSALAKQLLKAVPDDLRGSQSGVKSGANAAPVTAANGTEPPFNGVGTPASAPPRKKSRPRKDESGRYSLPGDRGSTSTVSYSTPSLASPTDAAKGLNSTNTVGGVFPGSVSGAISAGFTSQSATQDPTFYDAEPMIIDDHPGPSGSQPPALKPEEKPRELPPPPPKDKEEAARKRGFGDLIDLTADDDSDDEPPPKKVIVPSNAAPFSVKPVPSNDRFRQPISYQQFVSQNRAAPSHPSPGFPQNAMPARDLFPQQTWNRPQMRPLAPVHTPQNRPKGPSEEQKQAERIRGKMLVEPIMRDRVARKSKYDSRTIARDVLLATNRHPDMRSLNGHLNIMQKLLGDHGGVIDGAGNKSDLATIRWDLIDPGEPSEEAKVKSKKISHREHEAHEVDDESDTDSHAKLRSSTAERPGELRNFGRKQVGRPRQVPKADRHYSSARDASPNILANEHPELTSDLRSRASRGSSAARRESAASLHTPRAGVRGQKKPSSMSKSASSTPVVTGTATGYAAFRPLDENGDPVKKKGRPVGWRKSVHSREAQGLTPYGVHGPKTTSKLRQSTGVRESSEKVMPHYQVYPCKWKGCSSELDNLEKLKKHTLKLHGEANSEGDYECRWGDCGTGDHIDANNNIRPGDEGVTSFETLDHWFKHVNKAHIQAIAWKLGDGPRGGSVAEILDDSAAYLSDASGRSVTPIILTPQELAQQQADSTAGGGPERLLMSQEGLGLQYTGLDKNEREAAAELKKLEDQKRHEGVTMGLEGSRLANAKRRRGFLDDEDFEDVIEDSEPEF